jgi:hypothetical protein
MEKLTKVISNLKNFDLSSIANEKVVVCLAFIGLAATTKYVASYILDKKSLDNLKAA